MRIVLDTSAAVEIVAQGSKFGYVQRILSAAEEVLAPELFLAEIVNVIWKLCRFGTLKYDDGPRALESAMILPDHVVSHQGICLRAFQLSRGRPKAAYDMFYVALAEQADATLLTLNRALKTEASRLGVRTA